MNKNSDSDYFSRTSDFLNIPRNNTILGVWFIQYLDASFTFQYVCVFGQSFKTFHRCHEHFRDILVSVCCVSPHDTWNDHEMATPKTDRLPRQLAAETAAATRPRTCIASERLMSTASCGEDVSAWSVIDHDFPPSRCRKLAESVTCDTDDQLTRCDDA